MAHIIFFHHAHGKTEGVEHFADRLRALGHEVLTPDLYEGQLFDDLDEGVAYAQRTGFDVIINRGVDAAANLAPGYVAMGMSLGCMPAQMLAQTGPASKAVLLHGLVPFEAFGGPWPEGKPFQVHITREDPWEDVPGIEALLHDVPEGYLYLYEGDAHLFCDDSMDTYNESYTETVLERITPFVATTDAGGLLD